MKGSEFFLKRWEVSKSFFFRIFARFFLLENFLWFLLLVKNLALFFVNDSSIYRGKVWELKNKDVAWLTLWEGKQKIQTEGVCCICSFRGAVFYCHFSARNLDSASELLCSSPGVLWPVNQAPAWQRMRLSQQLPLASHPFVLTSWPQLSTRLSETIFFFQSKWRSNDFPRQSFKRAKLMLLGWISNICPSIGDILTCLTKLFECTT